MFGLLLVTDDALGRDSLDGFVSRLGPDATLVVCHPDEDVAQSAAQAQPHLVLIDMLDVTESRLAQLRAVRQAVPLTWIAVMASSRAPESLGAIVDAGANEVVPRQNYLSRVRSIVRWLLAGGA